MSRKWMVAIAVLLVAGTLLSACGPTAAPTAKPAVDSTKVPATAVPTKVPPTAVPPTEPPEAKTMVICLGQEPDSLYIYGSTMLTAAYMQSAVFDGPIDTLNFSYQPVIITKLPALTDGDAVIGKVEVDVGSKVLAVGDIPVELTDAMTIPIRLRPAGCYTDQCAVEWLPASGSLEMEQMAVTFKLVDGLTWADGTPVKASDSVYSFKLALDPDTPNATRYVAERTTSYEATDDKTVVWTGLPGYRDSAYMTNIWAPLPEHQLGQMTAAEIVSSEEASRLPMGYGPYTTQEWVTGDHITLVKNPYYFRLKEGLPKVDTMIFRFVGEDPNTAVASLLAGECDILTQDLSLDPLAQLLLDLESRGQIKPQFVTGTSFEHLDFGITPVPDYTRPDFFGDVRMRQAIGMCLNRQQIIDELLYGRSKQVPTYLPPEHPMYNTDLLVLPYDPDAARKLLDEMNWKDLDNDGIRECSGCNVKGAEEGVTKLSFKWSSTTAPLRVQYMQIFQAQLKECGVDVTLDNIAGRGLFDPGPEGPLYGRHFDVASYTVSTGVEPPCNLYLSSEIPAAENGWAGQNNPGYSNAEFDAACSAALQSLPGTSEYEQYHKEAQKFFARDIPALPFYLRIKISASRPEVSGFVENPTANSAMYNIENFDITTK